MAATFCLVALVGPRGAARAASLTACSGDQVASATTDARNVHGAVIGITAISTWGTVRCSLRERLTIAIEPASDRESTTGALVSISGNPARKRVREVLRPGDVLVYSWRWRNWCAHPGRFIVQAFWSGSAYTAPTPSQAVTPPTCTARDSRSTLLKTRPSITACPAAAYRAGAGLGQPFMSRLIDSVGITLRKRHPPCLLRHTHIKFTVQTKHGSKWSNLSQVQGNPGSRTIGTMLTPTYGGFSVLWAWSNWCGGGNHFRAVAKIDGRTVAGPAVSHGATCEGQGSPSTLTPSYGHS